MTNTRLTIDEAEAFLDANPVGQWIDAFVFDRSLHALYINTPT